MKPKSSTLAALAAAFAGAGSTALAAPPVVTTAAATTPFAVSSTDLLQTALGAAPVLTGQFITFSTGGETALRDGDPGSATTSNDFPGSAGISTDSSVTYTFNLAASPLGYDITAIETFAAWDEGRDRQDIAIGFSTVDNPAVFVTLTGYSFDPSPGAFSRVTVTPGAGDSFLMQNVHSIRFVFPTQENSAAAYREIDVFGVSAVPEPASWALMLGGAALLAWRRRVLP